MKWISILTGLLTLTVALFSFSVSFVSLENISSQFGFPIPFLFPLTVEAGVVIFSLNALYRYLNQEKTIWQWLLVIFSSCLALTFNVLHAQNNLISQVMFAIPSLFFLLAFENFLSQIKYVTKKNLTQNSLTNLLEEIKKVKTEFQVELGQGQTNLTNILTNIEKSKVELQTIKAELKEAKKQLEQSKIELENISKNSPRTDVILESIKNGNLRINDLASEFEVSSQTIYNDVKRLEKEGLISKNGKGWKVI